MAAFGYAAQQHGPDFGRFRTKSLRDKVTWEEGKRMPSIAMDLDEHFEQVLRLLRGHK